jgi:beta-lactamase superfamily II metal-dependent hydrolase
MSFTPPQEAVLQVFNVEHGACALLTCNSPVGYKRLMVDCGHNATTGWTPGEHLRLLGASTLEQLVVTNYDEDHVSGFRSFAANGVEVEWIKRNPSVSPSAIRSLKSEDGMGPGIDALATWLDAGVPPSEGRQPHQFPGVQMEPFFNHYPAFDDENNLSLVLYLNIYGYKFLFPGDMECAGFEYLLATNARFRQIVGDVTVLVASHHGRRNGICEDMFTTHGCCPKVVVISDDYKQYDTQETTTWYANRCVGFDGFRGQPQRRRVLSTRSDGELRFTITPGNCVVE